MYNNTYYYTTAQPPQAYKPLVMPNGIRSMIQGPYVFNDGHLGRINTNNNANQPNNYNNVVATTTRVPINVHKNDQKAIVSSSSVNVAPIELEKEIVDVDRNVTKTAIDSLRDILEHLIECAN